MAVVADPLLCLYFNFEAKFVSSNPQSRPCKWQLYWSEQPVRWILGIIQVFFKLALPSLAMLLLFIHMVYKSSKPTVASVQSRAKMRGNTKKMVGAAALVLVICFAPSEINFALAMAGKTRLDTKLHHILSLLVFVSSCLNPYIYGLSNRSYRRGFQKVLLSVCPQCIRGDKNRVRIERSPARNQHSGSKKLH